MNIYLIGFSILIFMVIETSFIFSVKEIEKYLIKNDKLPINILGGLNFKDFIIFTFLNTYRKSQNNSKQDKDLLYLTIFQITVKYGILISWFTIFIIKIILK